MKLHSNTLHERFLDELAKVELIAKLQLDNEIIKRSEYNRILLKLFDKGEIYKKNLESIKLPKLDLKNFEHINLFEATDILFSTS